jgi:uncharacterized protein
MKYLFFMGHPAHFHLFKNIILGLQRDSHDIKIVIKTKDVLEDLLVNQGFPYTNIHSRDRKDSQFSIGYALLKRDIHLFKICLKEQPDLMLGSATEISHVGTLLKIPSVVFSEDDAAIIPQFSNLTYPFTSHILSPIVCDNGKWEYKTIKYKGYHELSYLHPVNFVPSRNVVEKYFSTKEPFAILRFAKLKAYHDSGIKGLDDRIAARLIDLLKKRGRVFITSERKLPIQFEQYRIAINPLDIHHVIKFAYLYIGDSQTMSTEAAVLGTPFIRFNDFVGRIGTLRELEDHYKLGFGISPKEPDKLFEKVEELLQMENLDYIFEARKLAMLNEKIDVSQFYLWFIRNYPKSVYMMRERTDSQFIVN